MKNPLIHILTILVGLQVTNAAFGATTYEGDVPTPTFSEVSYGPHGRNVLDFWQARSDQPSPLVVIIHGGGWTQGSKERAIRFADVQLLLDVGISVAANNYRLI